MVFFNSLFGFLEMLFPIRQAFVNPNANNIPMVIFAVFIIYLAWFYFQRFYTQYNEIQNGLIEINAIINSHDIDTIVDNFENINMPLSKNMIIGSLWREYAKTLVKVQNENGGYSVFSTVDAAGFISEESVIAQKMNLDLYGAVPGIFTGLGILGTFLGLTIGLSQINLGSADVEVLKIGIKNLLGGMGTAFSTSLWGLVLSLIFSYLQKKKINKLKTDICSLQDKLDSIFVRRPTEFWLADSLDELKMQTRELKTFNTDLAMSIGEALEIKLAQSFQPTFDKLLEAIVELSHSGASKVAQSISNSAGKELVEFGRTLQEVQNSISNSIESSQAVTKQMTDTFESQIKTSAENLTRVFEEAAIRQQSISVQTDKQLMDVLAAVEGSFENARSQFEKANMQSTENMVLGLQSATDTLSRVAEEFEKRMNTQGSSLENQTKEMSFALHEAASEVSHAYVEGSNEFKNLIKEIGDTVREMKEAMVNAGEVAHAFSGAAEPIKETGLELKSALQNMQAMQQRFTSSMVELHDKIGNTNSSTTQSLEIIRRILEETRLAWNAYENKFGVVRQDLEGVFTELEKGLGEYQNITGQSLNDHLRDFDEKISKVIQYLNGIIEQLQETIDGFSEAAGAFHTNN